MAVLLIQIMRSLNAVKFFSQSTLDALHELILKFLWTDFNASAKSRSTLDVTVSPAQDCVIDYSRFHDPRI